MPSGRKKIVGLDLGRFAVKAVWAEVSSQGLVITRAESLRLPSEGADRSGIILPWLSRMGIGHDHCVIGLPARQAMFQPFLLQANDPRTPQQVAAVEVIRFTELASEEMTYDFSPFEIEPGQRRIMLAMAKPSALAEMTDFARQAGLDLLDIVPTPVALYHALMPQVPDDQRPVLFINVGHAGTEVAVGTPAGLMFARFFPVGGGMFTDALMRARQISEAQAEHLKATEGSLLEDSQTMRSVLLPVADVWARELESCLSVYRSLYPGERLAPRRIVLCGGGTEMPGFCEFVARKLGIEVVPAGALGDGDISGRRFAVAAGLVASQLPHQPVRLSLLPEQMRSELLFRRQKPFWIAAAVTGALILGVSIVGGYRDIQRKEKQLSLQRASLARRHQLVAEIESVKARGQQIREMAAPVKELLHAGPTIRNLLELLSNSMDRNDWITMVADAESYFAVPSEEARRRGPGGRVARIPEPEVPPSARRLKRIIIEGYTVTRNLATVKRLITKLNSQKWIASADLLLDDELVSTRQPTPPGELTPTDRRMLMAQRFVLDVRLASQ